MSPSIDGAPVHSPMAATTRPRTRRRGRNAKKTWNHQGSKSTKKLRTSWCLRALVFHLLFENDLRRLALLQAELRPNPRGDGAIDLRVLALRLRLDDRVAFV